MDLHFGASFAFSMLFGLIGAGYFLYGRKQQKFITMIVGVGLGIYPYFVSNVVALVVVGILLMAVPFFIQE